MTLDRDQLAAVDERRNIVVSAGAGSGKTRVLTARYVSLIERGEARVDEILALTFTRKAAAEMFQRIFAMLRSRAAGSDAARRAVAHFDDAQISTLDSFCASVLRDCAARFGLPPTVTTDEDRLGRIARREALAFLQRAGDERPLASFVRSRGVPAVLDLLLVPLITQHFRLSSPIDGASLVARQGAWLDDRLAATDRQIAATVAAIGSLDDLDDSWRAVRDAIVDAADDHAALEAILSARVPTKRSGDHPAFKDHWNALFAKKGPPRGLLPDRAMYHQSRERLGEIAALWKQLEPLQLQVLEGRRTSGIVGYREVMELAIRALVEDPELRDIYKRRYRTIMIDEFQDNDATQRDLLFLLAEHPDRSVRGIPGASDLDEARLFFVGDQKQSIYRFRGADVSVFKRLAAEIGNQRSLSCNYRSSPALIAWFNRFFAAAFGGAERDFEAEYEAAATPESFDGAGPGHAPAVTVAWAAAVRSLPRDDDDPWASSDLTEADWVAQRIRSLLDGEDSDLGAVAPGDVAILFRSGGNQHIYERMLRRRGVPYRSQAIRSLFTDAPAADITALLRLVWFPDDRESYAAVLRSPFARVSDEAVIDLLVARAALFAPVESLAEDDRLRLAAAAAVFERLCSMPDRVPHTELIRFLWDEAGYRYALLARPANHPYLEHFDYLQRLARRYADRPAIELVDYLTGNLGQFAKLDEDVPAGDGDAVQLSTIHGAKGLEYPIVFVVGMDSSPNRRDAQLVWEDPELGLTVTLPGNEPGDRALNAISAHARRAEEDRDRAEALRVLYVAATRAEKRLYLSAGLRHRDTTKTDADTSHFRTVVTHLAIDLDGSTEPATIWDGLCRIEPIPPQRDAALHGDLGRRSRRSTAEARDEFDGAEIVDRRPARLHTTPSALNRAWRLHAGAAAVPHEARETGDADATALGTLTHAVLERVIDGVATISEVRERPPWVRRLLPDDASATMVEEAATLADSFLRDPLWQELRGTARSIETELPFLLAHDGASGTVLVAGTVDLVIERADSVDLIDYKTDREMHPADYAAQLALYREAVRRLYQKPVRARLYFLRHRETATVDLTFDDLVASADLGRLASLAVD